MFIDRHKVQLQQNNKEIRNKSFKYFISLTDKYNYIYNLALVYC